MRRFVCLLFCLAPLIHVQASERESGTTELAGSELCKVNFTQMGDDDPSGVYRGECRVGVPHGKGVVEFSCGDRLEGHFVRGVIQGEGRLTTVSGNIYKGHWKDGKRHGRGTFTWSRGSAYDGQWLNDKRHGHGVFTWANGNRFEGEFRDNKQFYGRYYTVTGKIYECRMGQCQ